MNMILQKIQIIKNRSRQKAIVDNLFNYEI